MSRPDRKIECKVCGVSFVAMKVGEKRAFSGPGKLLAVKKSGGWVCACCDSARRRTGHPDPAAYSRYAE